MIFLFHELLLFFKYQIKVGIYIQFSYCFLHLSFFEIDILYITYYIKLISRLILCKILPPTFVGAYHEFGKK